MRKMFLLFISAFVITAQAIQHQNDLDYQKEPILKILEPIGSVTGGVLASPFLLIGRFEIVSWGAKKGRNGIHAIASRRLAKKYDLNREIIRIAIDYRLTISQYRDIFDAAYTHNKSRLAQLIAQEMYLFFGKHWQQSFRKMLHDFEKTSLKKLQIYADRRITIFQREQQLASLEFFLQYNPTQIKLFGLIMRLFRIVYVCNFVKEWPFPSKSDSDKSLISIDSFCFSYHDVIPVQQLLADLYSA